MATKVAFHGKQVIISTSSFDWGSVDKIIESELFSTMLHNYIVHLRGHDSDLLKVLPKKSEKEQEQLSLALLKALAKKPGPEVMKSNPEFKEFFRDLFMLDQFVEEFYNYWRSFERFIVCYSEQKDTNGEDLDRRPYRVFNDTIENLNHTVRKVYRDIREHITGEHPIIYRQVPAGCQVGVIAASKQTALPSQYSELQKVNVIRQVLIQPPLIIDPPNNKRKGEFAFVSSNPLEGLKLDDSEWLCFPAKVGELVIYLYFHDFYFGLGIATSNLFELCSDEELKKRPDGIYVYGVPNKQIDKFAPEKTVYWLDKKNNLMVGAIPLGEEFGYFGYVKKMMLTLYNSIMIMRGRMPVHGAMTRITLKNGSSANVVIFGDTGTGKSESLEAFRILSEGNLKDMKIVFDDMGSLELKNGKILAYGTETGAFVRLDDLQAGYAFGQIDRSIIMSPQKVNARAVLPITTLQEILHGWPVDFFLYANNYEQVEAGQKHIKFFRSPEEAMKVFGEGKRMAKGTTNETGIVGAYYANIFGPSQLRELHEPLAKQFFEAMFKSGVKVGQINTQLGVKGKETDGPQEAAKELFELIKKK